MTPISNRELDRRWSAARRIMMESGIDAIVMQSSNDFLGGYGKWFTDIPSKHHYPRTIIFYSDSPMTVVDMGHRDTELRPPSSDPIHRGVDLILYTPAFFSVAYTNGYHAELIAADLKRHNVRHVAWLSRGALPHQLISHVEQALTPGTLFSDITDLIDEVKAIKSEEEQGLIRATARMQDDAFSYVLDTIKPGMRDADVVAIAEHFGRLHGSEQGVFLGSSAKPGHRAPFLDSHYLGRAITKGDHFTILIENNGPGGLYTEIARTVVLGKATDELLEDFESVKKAQDYTLSLLKPGTKCADVAIAYNQYMQARNLPTEGRLYCHSQGHDLVERPLVRHDETMAIQEGMNFAVHPNYTTQSNYAVICDNYLIGATGPGECLHQTAKKIFEI